MGIFHDTTILVNRTPIDLTVTFDGQEKTLVPGENMVPRVTVNYAKNQNPIMGSFDPNNPNISGGRYLVGEKVTDGRKQKDDITPLTDAEWADHLNKPCRMDAQALFEENYGSDPKARLMTYGKGKRTVAKSLYEAGVKGERIDSEAFSARD